MFPFSRNSHHIHTLNHSWCLDLVTTHINITLQITSSVSAKSQHTLQSLPQLRRVSRPIQSQLTPYHTPSYGWCLDSVTTHTISHSELWLVSRFGHNSHRITLRVMTVSRTHSISQSELRLCLDSVATHFISRSEFWSVSRFGHKPHRITLRVLVGVSIQSQPRL